MRTSKEKNRLEGKEPSEVAEEILKAIFYREREQHCQGSWVAPYFPETDPGDRAYSEVFSFDDILDPDAPKHLCDTSACVAGWAALLSGKRFEIAVNEFGLIDFSVFDTEVREDGEEVEVKHPYIGQVVSEVGQKALGLSEEEKDFLFFNTIDDQAIAYLYLMTQNGGKLEGLPATDLFREMEPEDFFEKVGKSDFLNGLDDFVDIEEEARLVAVEKDQFLIEELVDLAEKKYTPAEKGK